MAAMSPKDRYLFHEGTLYDAYNKLGAHPAIIDGEAGVLFRVWAPHAQSVSVLTALGGWQDEAGVMVAEADGIWSLFLPGVQPGDCYRFAIIGADGHRRLKSDPYAFYSELRPNNGSIVASLKGYEWHDAEFFSQKPDPVNEPMAIYEVHLGSWKKQAPTPENPSGFLNYRELAGQLAEYMNYMGYTHAELMGICEHPLDNSWGYQVTGYFSPTSRYGTPDDFRYFVDVLHQHNIRVILDWVPAHFPKDPFGLAEFDGTALYESADPLLAEYPEWGTKAFDHSQPEVRSFLISSAFYWVKEFHIDALRVDAVAAMLHTNFSRAQWRPNKFGGTENLDSIAFLRQLNQALREHTNAFMIAEDSSIYAGVTEPVEEGGLGFLFKWNMGWMNETLRYFAKEPVYRRWHHHLLTHSLDYAFLENYVLPLSHDEVVHLKHSMFAKQPGNHMDMLAGLKTLYAWQFTHPGKKLLFMGQDFAQEREWDEGREIDWFLTDDLGHRDVMDCVRRLIHLYCEYPVLHTDAKNPVTFEWVNAGDAYRNTLSYIRRNPWNYESALLVILNLSPVQYDQYAVGVPVPGSYRRVFSTYDSLPGMGSPEELGAAPELLSAEEPADGYERRLTYDLRPFEGAIFELPQ